MSQAVKKLVRDEVVTRIPAAASAVGSYYAGAPGAAVGKLVGGALQRKIAKLVGSGDYTLNEAPVRNSLFPGSKMPGPDASFTSEHDLQRICFREYVTDIVSTGSSDFVLRSLNIQPGLSASFPYLSNIAPSFESYKLRGLVYEYVPMVSPYATAAMGSVMLTCSYNATAVPPSSRSSMENLNGCIVHRPDKSSMYGVECEGQNYNGYFVRVGDTTTPNNLEDFGRFYVATAGMSATQYPAGTVLGELWVTYDVVLAKHRIPLLIAGYSDFTRVTGVSNSAPLGTAFSATPVFLGAVFPVSVDSTTLYLGDSTNTNLGTIAPGMCLDIDFIWNASGSGTLTIPAFTYTNCSQVSLVKAPDGLTYAANNKVIACLKLRLTAVNATIVVGSFTGTTSVNGVEVVLHSIGPNGTYQPGTSY